MKPRRAAAKASGMESTGRRRTAAPKRLSIYSSNRETERRISNVRLRSRAALAKRPESSDELRDVGFHLGSRPCRAVLVQRRGWASQSDLAVPSSAALGAGEPVISPRMRP